MVSLFNYFAIVHNQNLVRIFYRRYSVGDNDTRFALHITAKAVQYFFFRTCIHSRQAIVENKYLRFFHNGARDRNPLFLPTRKRDTALAYKRFKALVEL